MASNTTRLTPSRVRRTTISAIPSAKLRTRKVLPEGAKPTSRKRWPASIPAAMVRGMLDVMMVSVLYAGGRQRANALATVRLDETSRGARAGITTALRSGIQRATSACFHHAKDNRQIQESIGETLG